MDADVCSHMSYNDAEYEYIDEGTSKSRQNDEKKFFEKIKFNRKLIRLIKSKPIIYDRNQSKKKPFERKMAWKYIAKKMNISVEKCRERWSRLRMTFCSTWKIYTFNGCPKPAPEWTYFKDLEFLIPHVSFRTFPSTLIKLHTIKDTSNSSTSVSADSMTAVQEWETIEIDDDDDYNDIPQPEDSDTRKIGDENIKVKEEVKVTQDNMKTGIHPRTRECDQKHIGPKENDLRYEEELKAATKLCTHELNQNEEYAENDNDTINTGNISYEEELKVAIKFCSDEIIENKMCDENAEGVIKIEDSDTELQEAMQCNAVSSDEYNQNEVCGEDDIEDIKNISVKCEKEAQEVMKMYTVQNDNDEKCEEYDLRYNNNEGCTDEENLRTDTRIPIGVKKEPETTDCKKNDNDLQIDVPIKEECQTNDANDINGDLVESNTDITKTADLTCEIGAQMATLVGNDLNNDLLTILKERTEGITSKKDNSYKKKDSESNINKGKYTGFLSDKSTRKTDEKLLKLVKEYPVLYTADGRSVYHTRTDRFYAWKEIARQTRKSVKECQQRWTFLHRHLVHILKMGSNLKSARNDKKERYEKWLVKFKWFQTHMYFMEHQLLARKTIPSFEMLSSAIRNMVQKEVKNECDKLSADIDNIDKIDEDSLSDHENDESILKLYLTDVLKKSNGQKISSEDIEDDDLANYKNFFS